MRILFSERKKSKNQIGLDNRFKGLKPIKTGRQTRGRVRRVAFLKQTLHSGDPVHLHAPPPGPQLPEGSGGILAAGAPGWLFPQAPPGGGCGGAASEDRLMTRPRLLCLHSHARGKVHGPRGRSAHAATKVVTRRGAQPGRGHGTGACGSPKQSGWAITGQPGDCQHRHCRGNAWPVAPWGGGVKSQQLGSPQNGQKVGRIHSKSHSLERKGRRSIHFWTGNGSSLQVTPMSPAPSEGWGTAGAEGLRQSGPVARLQAGCRGGASRSEPAVR